MNDNLYRYIFSWCILFDGIIGVLTFGLIVTDLGYKVALFQSKLLCEKYKKQQENKNGA